MNNYLPLTEYSSKYKVSISTLRRRIKSKDIHYRLDQGKYLILDENQQRPSQETAYVVSEPRPSLKKTENEVSSQQDAVTSFSNELFQKAHNDEPVLTAANRLLTELKKAYSQILQEKEEQMLHLKEEVADLKTLVRVLESENERLKNQF